MKSILPLSQTVRAGVAVVSLLLAHGQEADAAFTEHGATVLGGANFNSRSASLADIDNDGDLDVMFQGVPGAQQLFRNNIIGSGSLSFTNISNALPAGLGSSWSAAWGDYDGDGNMDVFVGQSNPSNDTGDVLRGDGLGGFTNTSVAVGLDDPGFHQNIAWVDIDNDRDLDLIFGMEGPEKHEIYLQGSGGSFTPVGAAVGFQEPFGAKGYGMAVGDTDGDGDLDIYISTCIFGGNIRNNFYENQLAQTGSLSFIDIADGNGTQYLENSYGSEFYDFDDDGDLDLFMVGADAQDSKIFRNDGSNQFTDVDSLTGHPLLSDNGGDLNGGKAIDYDNDGDLDLFFHDHRPGSGRDVARKLYRNDGNWSFTDVTILEGLNEANEGAYDSTWADIDMDGDQDLIAPTDGGSSERVYLSDASTNDNHWLAINLSGPSDNTSGIGAVVYATLDEGTPEQRTLRREANTNAGTFNQSDVPVHFGLGDETLIDELKIAWPDGTVQIINDVTVDQFLDVKTPGDFDGDHQVDLDDLAQWQADYGIGPGSDSNLDGLSNGFDLLAWQQQFGNGVKPPTATQVVPEPSIAILLLLLAAAAVACGRRNLADNFS
ncbi:CRTAC1 family protein [Adhaeretor mobilis]|uniref:FG-GAP repeat protein n=1 Tax=Adhaeretor mobilis TaxID=1930276 RepID=A0A517MQF8_9BACT|nr:CRTAC1 family protein [Adhaeretor mobilis]QDS97116.1 FG-GAP repeat protein [Adhaeretor mobilis]